MFVRFHRTNSRTLIRMRPFKSFQSFKPFKRLLILHCTRSDGVGVCADTRLNVERGNPLFSFSPEAGAKNPLPSPASGKGQDRGKRLERLELFERFEPFFS